MADENKPAEVTPNTADAIKAYYDAKTAKEKAAVVAKFPFLKAVFSEANHQG